MPSGVSFAARLLFAVWLLVLQGHPAVELAGAETAAATSEFRPPKIEIAPGYVVELAAGPPLVKYPMMACFDERGRLFIAESDGQNLGKQELLEQQPRFVRMLQDIDGDGKFDKSTIFADKMVMPEGALWHDGALYVLSAPYLWRLEDTDGDGVADRREKLVGQMDLIGNANQHGPYLAPDGRILFSGGTFGYDLVGKDGKHAGKGAWASVFSCMPDGTDVRIECHAGINPVEVAFTAEGEMLGTCAIFDQIGGRHDALAHWVHGATYGEYLKPPTLKQTGRYLPAACRWGQVAPAGLIRYRGTYLGEHHRDCLFACQYNTHALARIRLERDGATFRGHDEVFLSSPSIDFHPADVLEDADGSLLVIDTGGWLTMGCPTSKIGKPQAYGAIYRVRKVVGPTVSDPRGLKLDWSSAAPAELAVRLDDPRPAIRDRAMASLASQAGDAVPALGKSLEPSCSLRMRRGAVWTLARIGTTAARSLLCEALADPDPGVRQAAAHCLGNLRESLATAPLTKIVAEDELPVRREAATALGLIGQRQAVPALFESLRSSRDEFLEHALIYALIEIQDPASTRAGLIDPLPRVQRAALIALDQMPGGELTRAEVAPLLASADTDVQRTALTVIAGHPGWAEEIVELLGGALQASPPSPAQHALIAGGVTAFAKHEQVQSVVAAALGRSTTPQASLFVLLEAIQSAEIEQLPQAWVDPLSKLLATADDQVSQQVIAAIAAFDVKPFAAPLLSVARDAKRPKSFRVAALAAVTRRGLRLADDDLSLLIEQVQSDVAPVERLAAARALGQATLSADQLALLPPVVEQAGPLELPSLLRAFESKAGSDRVAGKESLESGQRLAAALAKSPGLPAVPAARVKAVLSPYPPEVLRAIADRLPRQESDDVEQRKRLADLAAQADDGDPERGRQLFSSNRAACSTCHRVAGSGGQIGPDLSRIAQVRTTRDLAESILVPSATLANGFESVTIATQSGQVLTGLIRRETADAIHLATTDQPQVRVRRAEIEEITPSQASVMPQGLEKLLTPEQLRDVVAYLRTLK